MKVKLINQHRPLRAAINHQQFKTNIMDKSTELHLGLVTSKALLEFKDKAFCSFASSCGESGYIEIGVNAYGEYVVVKDKDSVFVYDNTREAIEKYTQLLSKKDK